MTDAVDEMIRGPGNSGGTIPPIDIHLHWCAFGRPLEQVAAELEWLEGWGYGAVVFYALPGFGAPPEKVVDLIPGDFQELTGIDETRTAYDDLETWREFRRLWAERKTHQLAAWGTGDVQAQVTDLEGKELETADVAVDPHAAEMQAAETGMQVLSFLDVRAWDGETDIGPWWNPEGDPTPAVFHAGLKDILILEEDGEKMRMKPIRLVPGLSREEYLDRHRMSFRLAAEWDVPLVYHADLGLHHDFVEECLERHPNVRVSIPHFGFSRRRIGALMERFPGVYTDTAFMAPHMAKDPPSYRDFVLTYPDRVLLGSDAIASFDLRRSCEYVDAVRALELPAESEEAVLARNARRFLGWTSV